MKIKGKERDREKGKVSNEKKTRKEEKGVKKGRKQR